MKLKNTYLLIEDYNMETGEKRFSIDMVNNEILEDMQMKDIKEYNENIHIYDNKDISTEIYEINNSNKKELIKIFLNNGYQEDFKSELREEIKTARRIENIANI